MTQLIYKEYFKSDAGNHVSFETFQMFVKGESQGKELLDAYHNTFENRYLNIPDTEDLMKIQEFGIQSPLYFENLKDEVKSLMKPIKELDALLLKTVQIAQGESKVKSITYQKNTYSKRQIQEAYDQIIEDRNVLLKESFLEWDKKFCYAHLGIALQVDAYDQLNKHYKQHIVISEIYKSFLDGKAGILNAIQQIQSNSSATEDDVRALSTSIKNSASEMEVEVGRLDEIDFVELPNIDTLKELKESIIKSGDLAIKPGNIFENGHFQNIVETIERVLINLQRVDQKSIASLLLKQNTILTRWKSTLD